MTDEETDGRTPLTECLRKETARAIIDLLEKLPEREREVAVKRFYEHKTLAGTAKELGGSRERIRQIEAKMLRKLRHPCMMNKLRECAPFPVWYTQEEGE